jgi:DUF4097 and DUF4098 domain-containing protein YvlB
MASLPTELGHPRLRITTGSGSITVTAEERADVVVDRGSLALAEDGAVAVQGDRRSASIKVRCPIGSALVVGTASGGVRLGGRLGSVSVTTASGSVRADAVELADVRTHSGSVEVEVCVGRCRVATTSGRVVVSHAGEADVSTVSGKVDIQVAGTTTVRTVSGHVAVESGGGGPVGARTVSGSIKIRLPAGVRPALSVAGLGRVRCDCEPGDDVAIDVATVGGRVEIDSD